MRPFASSLDSLLDLAAVPFIEARCPPQITAGLVARSDPTSVSLIWDKASSLFGSALVNNCQPKPPKDEPHFSAYSV